MEKQYPLKFELVPDGCWYSNLRSLLSQEQWDIVRKDAYARADGTCMICGAPSSRLEAHESWSYDEERKIQKLERVIAVCKRCHEVIHIGRTQLKGDIRRAEDHFMQVNGTSYAEYRKELGKANEAHARRSRMGEWAIDLSWLQRFSFSSPWEEVFSEKANSSPKRLT